MDSVKNEVETHATDGVGRIAVGIPATEHIKTTDSTTTARSVALTICGVRFGVNPEPIPYTEIMVDGRIIVVRSADLLDAVSAVHRHTSG